MNLQTAQRDPAAVRFAHEVSALEVFGVDLLAVFTDVGVSVTGQGVRSIERNDTGFTVEAAGTVRVTVEAEMQGNFALLSSQYVLDVAPVMVSTAKGGYNIVGQFRCEVWGWSAKTGPQSESLTLVNTGAVRFERL